MKGREFSSTEPKARGGLGCWPGPRRRFLRRGREPRGARAVPPPWEDLLPLWCSREWTGVRSQRYFHDSRVPT